MPDQWTPTVKQSKIRVSHSLLSRSVYFQLALFCCCLSTGKAHKIRPFSKKINAPGPKPWPFIGNTLDTRKFNGVHLLLCDYIQRYGKVFAFTLGDRPSVVIADPDMLKQILVKDFWNFPNHAGRVDLAGSFSKSVFFARDDAWKRIRTTLTPTFSAKKIKGMIALIEESCDRLMTKIEQVVDTG